jgi:hypothetical protein
VYWPEDSALASIKAAGGTVQVLTAPEYAGALAVALPDTVTDESLEHMTALEQLRPAFVQLRGRDITGRGLASLTRLGGLKGLVLHSTGIVDSDLEYLKAFPELTTLNLDGSRLTGEALKHLERLPKLRSVSLRFTTLPGEAVRQFAASHKEVLVLSEFTDKDGD